MLYNSDELFACVFIFAWIDIIEGCEILVKQGFLTKSILVLMIFLSVFTFFNCTDLFTNVGPLMVDYTYKDIILSWDDDEYYIQSAWSIDHYNLYYRDFRTFNWNYLDSTKGSETIITVHQNVLSYGKYEFAIEAVFQNGETSDLHSSTDFFGMADWWLVYLLA